MARRAGVEAVRAAYDAHAASLLRFAVALTADRALAEDIVHDAFVRLHRASRPPAAGAEAAFLRRTITNLVHDHHRHGAVVRRLAPAPRDPAPSAETTALGGDRARAVASAVVALPARQRDCVALHYFAGLPDAAVAAELGISVGSVKTHLHRARAALTVSLEDHR
ncbi:RNA polymerase sigma factor [Iamia sp. SCSIO 61187]|uniref:RNA polymerase sigma factor n=1 Tax=Iamia sp. SCSIO 61187 TaxID=2722752 RepID=UPI001C6371FC|nr:RNA polymerase sigma factor [Iamia sp. SCSIO 61187]QYG93889.1 RNA polymerase sigma factor [Iamia sp. SCSIO 61187]